MGAITWLASYPKSGNTWVRIFLHNLILDPDEPVSINTITKLTIAENAWVFYKRFTDQLSPEALSNEEQARIRPKVHEFLSQLGLDHILIKTHNYFGTEYGAPTITPEVTKSAVYILRNPLDVAPSLARHYGVDLDEAIAQMGRASRWSRGDRMRVAEFQSSWSFNVESWTATPSKQILVLRYEDLVSRPGVYFKSLAKFIGMNPSPAQLVKAIRFSDLKALRAQESKEGFIERTEVATGAFFGTGGEKTWRDKLTKAQAERIIADHREQMLRFNYVPKEYL